MRKSQYLSADTSYIENVVYDTIQTIHESNRDKATDLLFTKIMDKLSMEDRWYVLLASTKRGRLG